MNGVELTMSVAAAANALACQLDDDQLILAVAVFALLHETLETLVVQREICNKKRESGNGRDGGLSEDEALWLSTL